MLKMTDVYRKDGGDSHIWLSRKSMGKVLTILMSFSACTSSRHMWSAYMGPRLRSLLSLSLGYSLVYLFEAPRPLDVHIL